MRRTVVVLLTLGLLILPAASAVAQANHVPFTSVLVSDPEPVDPGTVRETPSGMLLIRGLVTTGTETIIVADEEFGGTVTNTLNINLNPVTGRGALFGTFVLESEIDTWTGTVQGRIEGGLATGTFVGHGEGGTLQRGTFVETEPGVFDVDGVILERP